MIYRVENIEVDTDRFQIRRGGDVQQVEPQFFSLIELLISNYGHLVSKDELNLRVWGGRIVSDAVVNSRIRTARQVLGDDGKAQRLIETVRGRGFRFALEPRIDSPQISVIPSTAQAAPPNIEIPGSGSPPAIAVLPFQMLSDEPRFAMMADAIAHETIVELSRLHWLFVIARGSSFRFRGADVDLKTAGEVLGARYLLTGSVAVLGKRSMVTVELSQADDSRILWADRFETPLEDLLELRFAIVTRIVTALELRIPMFEAGRAAAIPTDNLDSWSAYHRGLWHMFRFNRHDNDIAARMFDRAIEADANFARAYAGRSFTHFQNAFVGYSSDPETDRELTRQFAEKSMELDPLDPFANLTLGRAFQLSNDMSGARTWLDRSVELNPNYALAIYNRALVDAITGQGPESETGTARAMALSPIDPLHYAFLCTRAISHIVRKDFDSAVSWAEMGAKAPNAHVMIRAFAAISNQLTGNTGAADFWVSEIQRIDGGFKGRKLLEAFPFSDDATRGVITNTLSELGLWSKN